MHNNAMDKFPELVAFDIDGTLVESGHELPLELKDLLRELVRVAHIALISGRSLSEIDKVLVDMPLGEAFSNKFFALPTCGSAMHIYNDGWNQEYAHHLPLEDQKKIEDVLHEHVFGTLFVSPHGDYGAHIINRGTAITFVAFDHLLSTEEKRAWDPTREKRERIKRVIEPLLTGYAVSIGGLGSLDITKEGMDKGFGIRALSKRTGIPEVNMIFVGDMLFPGGNDYPVTETGARTVAVDGPGDTAQFIRELLEKSR